MNNSGNSFEDKTSDSVIKKAINETLNLLKVCPAKFKAICADGSVLLFDTYEEAMSFYSKDNNYKKNNCKVFVI